MKGKGTRQGRVRARQFTCCFALLGCSSRGRAHVSHTLQPVQTQWPQYILCMSCHVANHLSCHIHQTNMQSSRMHVLELQPCYDVQPEQLEQVAHTSAASELCILVRQIMHTLHRHANADACRAASPCQRIGSVKAVPCLE